MVLKCVPPKLQRVLGENNFPYNSGCQWLYQLTAVWSSGNTGGINRLVAGPGRPVTSSSNCDTNKRGAIFVKARQQEDLFRTFLGSQKYQHEAHSSFRLNGTVIFHWWTLLKELQSCDTHIHSCLHWMRLEYYFQLLLNGNELTIFWYSYL